jgi:hypothetical protein
MQRFVLITLTLFCLFASCKKADPIIQPTQLEITVVDDLQNIVKGVNVTLFKNEVDWDKRSNPVATITTDALGKALFSVEPQTFFWWADGNCASNRTTSNTSTTSIKANNLSSVSTQIRNQGTLYLENNSTNKYKVEVNGVVIGDLLGKGKFTNPYALVGSYSVKVTQLDGYVLSPTIKTYSVPVSKCSTTALAFPF